MDTRILAVIVLYKMNAKASPAYLSLTAAAANTCIAETIEWVICDNSPDLQAAPEDFRGVYLQDSVNAGLAKRYNFALQMALKRGIEWVLLLDQDTSLTASYLAEILELLNNFAADNGIVACVPKLVQRGAVLSPFWPPAYYFRKPNPIHLDTFGKCKDQIHVFNSGALVRVKALQQIGGFPEHFWLDYLDHATFHALQAKGGRIYIMKSSLTHELSTNVEVRVRHATVQPREASILKASRDFYVRYGSFNEKAFFAAQLVRVVGGAFKHGEFRRFLALVRILATR